VRHFLHPNSRHYVILTDYNRLGKRFSTASVWQQYNGHISYWVHNGRLKVTAIITGHFYQTRPYKYIGPAPPDTFLVQVLLEDAPVDDDDNASLNPISENRYSSNARSPSTRSTSSRIPERRSLSHHSLLPSSLHLSESVINSMEPTVPDLTSPVQQSSGLSTRKAHPMSFLDLPSPDDEEIDFVQEMLQEIRAKNHSTSEGDRHLQHTSAEGSLSPNVF
jgi:hypothetical protein